MPGPTPARAPGRRAAARGAASPSELVGVLAVVLLIVGLVLASTTILIPALLGLLMLSATGGFLSMRLNPFAATFYADRKPSWTAIGMVFVSGILLLSAAYATFRSGAGPIWPTHGL